MNNIKTRNPGSSAAAVQHHYDIGNDFYRLWLGGSLTYTCALWEEEDDSYEQAQIRKLDFHINQARAGGAKRVLDVGCGWGSLLRRLVEVGGVEKAIGLTLSKAQAEWILSLNHPRIAVKIESWSDHSPEDPYDAIVSVGAFEHFATLNLSHDQRVDGYRAFFECCNAWLRPGGWMSLQTIVYENARRRDFSQFVATEIFPELDLPTLAEIAKASERLFEVVSLRNDRHDYDRTCRAWLSALRANRVAAVNLVGEDVVARYEKFLKFSIIGFHVGTMGLLRIAFHRIDHPRG